MAKKLFVGNLPYETNDQSLQELFATYGDVSSANIITDKFSGRSRGFGFVEFEKDDEAEKAISEMNGKEIGGRAIVVNEARPREERPNGGRNNRG
jgi:RNA recognition motif-containing protein